MSISLSLTLYLSSSLTLSFYLTCMCFPHLSCFTTTLCPSLSSSFTLLSRLLSPYINTNLPHIFLYFTYSLSYSLTQNTFSPLSLTYSFSLMHTIPQSLSLSPSHNLSHLSIFQLLFLSLFLPHTTYVSPISLSRYHTYTCVQTQSSNKNILK